MSEIYTYSVRTSYKYRSDYAESNNKFYSIQCVGPLIYSKVPFDVIPQSYNLKVLKWPARSPHLNPIENVWGVLAREVYSNGKQYFSVQELKDASE